MPDHTDEKPNLYALLIGIDCYLPNKLPGGGYYASLGGCVRDINHVEAFLTTGLGVPSSRILKLTATRGSGDQPTERRELWPTYENMVAKFKQLFETASSGDQIYIHYSGHGGRTLTEYPALKGADELDEALVPTDIGNSKARYLKDVELAYLLKAMVDKKLVVTIVLDSCHSGGATRGVATAVPRTMSGGPGFDKTNRPAGSDVATQKELEAAWRCLSGGKKGATPAGGWLTEPQGYTLLAACRANESAYEDYFDRREKNGALTYWLLDSLRTIRPATSYKMLHDRVFSKIRSWMQEQTPQLQGEGNRLVFGTGYIKPHYAIPVLTVDGTGKRIALNAGGAQGMNPGTLVAIYPPGAEDLDSPEGRQALAVVSDIAGDSDCWAEIKEQYDKSVIDQGAQAVVIGNTDLRLQRTVGLAIENKDLRKALGKAISNHGSNFIRLGNPDEALDFQVALDDRGEHFEIWDRKGTLIPNLRPPVPVAETGAPERIAKRLVHLAKYFSILGLTGSDTDTDRKLLVEIAGPPTTGGTALPPVYPPGAMVTLKIKNTLAPNPSDMNDPSRILNIAVLNLQAGWGIKQIYPSGAGASEILQPGKAMELKFKTCLPEGYDETRDVIKVFATQKTTNFRWLELPKIDFAARRTSAVLATTTPLENMLCAFTDPTAPSGKEMVTRALELVSVSGAEKTWAVAQVDLSVKKQL